MVAETVGKDSPLKFKAALIGNDPRHLEQVFGQGRREQLEMRTDLFPVSINSQNFSSHVKDLESIEVVFATWGMDLPLALKLGDLPNLKACFYAAGTVQHFARPLLEKNILVVSAWAANAIPVAQFTLGQILLSLKGYFRNTLEVLRPENRGRSVENQAKGIFNATVSVLGYGQVGRSLVTLLKPFDVKILIYDPFLSETDADRLGIQKVSLELAFAAADVVSNHLADLPPTKGLLNQKLFASMRQGATFINTGRGATVVENDLIATLRQRQDLTTLLDVTLPEPPSADSAWYSLENAHLSSHIAGSHGNEVVRMADYCLEEFEIWSKGGALRFAVTLPMLEQMA
jgi:phosphoglycerate dehydrogenase-like enzyme